MGASLTGSRPRSVDIHLRMESTSGCSLYMNYYSARLSLSAADSIRTFETVETALNSVSSMIDTALRDDSNSLPTEHSDGLRSNANIPEPRECPGLPRVPVMMCAIEFRGMDGTDGRSLSLNAHSIGGCHRSSLARVGMTIEEIRGHYRSSALI